ncbi:MAG TPA: 16S rRNA (guanine(527)-N(7))-methyltransferase RsmG [Planctomycetaceae bacterium]|nr:16S rRNA (guanine(527)-N(7))-methyltransferase RsmG [Planctomycetaceae bacterium]HRF00704.1 16S rRNA (guanine(527)-N(7))-methyltransferase RsmG [Pirellulaceae bacterium]
MALIPSVDELAASLPPLLDGIGLQVTDAQLGRLAAYANSLWSWNEKLNLTRHTTPELFVHRDVLDSWELSKELHEGEAVLDFGTGGGVPGIILSILRPDLSVTLVESVGKKANALTEIARETGADVTVCAGRGEGVLDDERFDAVVTRAVGPLKKLLPMLEEHWFSVGRLLAIKGPSWVEERTEARERGQLKKLQLRKVREYDMPGTFSKSVILKIWPEGADEK